MSAIIGVDVGGTFTDLFLLDEASGTTAIAKLPTSRPDQSRGVVEGIAATGAALRDVATVVHGTTVGTNALLERKGARAGLITTAGFRDVLEMRRRDRPETWGLWGGFVPAIPRDLRLEVAERVMADGTIATPVDLDAVRSAARELLARGAEAICVFFVNAYANDENERLAADAVAEIWPNDHVTRASRILNEIREFERGSTAALNAYLQPVLGRYLESLGQALEQGGFGGELLIVQSNGGVMAAAEARRLPVRTALSGPAAGVIAATHLARAAGFGNVITCDMGGTSFDVSLVVDGINAEAPQTEIDFGLVIRSPMIEITTISAGGGSIARVDRGGILRIGPDSAGSEPGPVCYGQGNDKPTVTDANVVMGRINAERPIGGRTSLDVTAAGRAIEREVGAPLGLDVMAAAEAIVRVANASMAGALRLVSVERGHDPRDFALMPFGGGGALHVGALIDEVGLARALVPRYPGITSALGCVVADMRVDYVSSLVAPLDGLDVARLDAEMVELSRRGRAALARAGVALERIEDHFQLDMLYQGQTHTIAVPLDLTVGESGTGVDESIVRTAFEAAYERAYGRLLSGLPIRVMNLRVWVVGRRPRFDPKLLAPGGLGGAEPLAMRPVWVGGGWTETPVFDRLALPVGTRIPGPAVLEQTDTTIFVEAGHVGRVDDFGNLVVAAKEAP